jgi:hypothetical protein
MATSSNQTDSWSPSARVGAARTTRCATLAIDGVAPPVLVFRMPLPDNKTQISGRLNDDLPAFHDAIIASASRSSTAA